MESAIIRDPSVLGGKPIVRCTRISVEFILELIASGATADDIVKTYPVFTRESVAAAVQLAADSLRGSSLLEVDIVR
jgi:uncharacterized protein (DUF433 family)